MDNRIVKFSIKVNAIHDYQWEVYRQPTQIKKILQIFRKNNMGPTGEKLVIFQKWQIWLMIAYDYIYLKFRIIIQHFFKIHTFIKLYL